ncbi:MULTISPECIES: cupredoxin domain-containing protein [Schleiferilactobacillus]|jgi:plastocyanin domain-containing protein|uniref:cupredoxin domain-containing protein n=1 Tax=Schleiferilactobacillus TaxID=2767891 RepID=UPI00235539EE|nr:cupredoxin domain-containing protein [Schleiferilactobacillus perolens]MCI2171458.1 cupredoxin domain-containing protein [Schleiferilactobacillus perolens]
MTKQQATIIVNGSYQPAQVTFKQGVPAELTFKRISGQGCLDQVQSADFNFRADLPLNEAKTFSIDTSKPGEYTFSCGMDMAHGKVVIQ